MGKFKSIGLGLGLGLGLACLGILLGYTTPAGALGENPSIIIPGSQGGWTNFFLQPTASDNHAVIKAGQGLVGGLYLTSITATPNWVRLYNATTGFNGCGSATGLVAQFVIPGLTTGQGISAPMPPGGLGGFTTGIAICVTSGYATTDTTNATASAISVNVLFN